jgi:HK97 family phage prohead protease
VKETKLLSLDDLEHKDGGYATIVGERPAAQEPPKTIEELKAELRALDAAIAQARSAEEREARIISLGVDVKNRLISGYAARFRADSRGDTFRVGAFTDGLVALARRRERIPLFVNHNVDVQIGEAVELLDDGRGLYGTFKLAGGARNDALLERLAELVWDGRPPGLSVGVKTERAEVFEGGRRIIMKATVMEVSLALGTEPRNDGCRIAPPDSPTELAAARARFPRTIQEMIDSEEREWARFKADMDWRQRMERFSRAR